jgi:antitoxin MazE
MEAGVLVAKWGNSLAVRLPKKLVEQLGLKAGDEVSVIATANKTLTIARDERREAALARLAAIKLNLPADYRFDRDEANQR